MASLVWNLIFFAIALGILITIHEAGHYFMARWCGVKVYRFSIGFGPVIYKRQLKNGTEFALSALPLGGYVRMKGEVGDVLQDGAVPEGEREADRRRPGAALPPHSAPASPAASASAPASPSASASAPASPAAAAVKNAVNGEAAPNAAVPNQEARLKARPEAWSSDFAEFRTGAALQDDNFSVKQVLLAAEQEQQATHQTKQAPPGLGQEQAAWESRGKSQAASWTRGAASGTASDTAAGAATGARPAAFMDNAPAAADTGDSFAEKTLGQRALIIAAGPLANLVLAFVLYTLINILGIVELRPVIGDVVPGTAAAHSGLQQYDQLVKVGDSEIQSWQEAITALVPYLGQTVDLEVAANMEKGPHRHLFLNLQGVELTPEQDLLTGLGIEPCYGEVQRALAMVVPDSPADAAGIAKGDIILAVNGEETPTWRAAQRAISAHGTESPLTLVIARQGETYTTILTPQLKYDEQMKKERVMIGIGTEVKAMPELYREVKYGPIDALIKAGSDTGRMSMLILVSAKKMLAGVLSPKNISGPISLAKSAGTSASIGFTVFLWFVATLSVNLGVLNLLPIPMLDGGQLVFLLYERITGHAPNERVQKMLIALGIAIILTLTFFAIFNDLMSLWSS